MNVTKIDRRIHVFLGVLALIAIVAAVAGCAPNHPIVHGYPAPPVRPW